MRNMRKIINIAVIFMILGVFLCVDLSYALRPTLIFKPIVKSDKNGNLELVEYPDENKPKRPSVEVFPKTYFGRDGHVVIYLVEQAVNKLNEGEELNILTLGSSTGQEGYDIAMTIAEYLSRTGKKIKTNIIISDVQKRLVDYAKRGIYGTESAMNPPREPLIRDDLTKDESAIRYRKFFKPIDSEKSRILAPEEFRKKWDINFQFETIDITSQERLDEIAFANGKFNIVLARNVHYGLLNIKNGKEILLHKKLAPKVFNNVDRILKDNGFVSFEYHWLPCKGEHGLKEACASILAKKDIAAYREFTKRQFISSLYYPSDVALGLKFVDSLVEEIGRTLNGSQGISFSMQSADTLEALISKSEEFGPMFRIFSVLEILFTRKDIDEQVRSYIIYWLRNWSGTHGQYPGAIIRLLCVRDYNYAQEKEYSVLFDRIAKELGKVRSSEFDNEVVFEAINMFASLDRKKPTGKTYKLMAIIFENFMEEYTPGEKRIEDRLESFRNFDKFTSNLLKYTAYADVLHGAHDMVYSAYRRIWTTGYIIAHLEEYKTEIAERGNGAIEDLIDKIGKKMVEEYPEKELNLSTDVDRVLIAKFCESNYLTIHDRTIQSVKRSSPQLTLSEKLAHNPPTDL